jgi:xanthine/uracil permease
MAAMSFVLFGNLGVTGWYTLLPQTTFNLIATMLHISHALGLGISCKMFIPLIGTALLRSNTLRGNTVVIAILVGKNIIVEGWCNMIL